MENISLIASDKLLQSAFQRCCKEYDHLEMFVAWLGAPDNLIPYRYLDDLKTVKAFVGIAFDRTSPDGIEALLEQKHEVSIVNSKATYHPKLYFFRSAGKCALLIGSSNFTYSGFSENFETNLLLEGRPHKSEIKKYLKEIRAKVKLHECFTPDDEWVKKYRKRYEARKNDMWDSHLPDESLKEDELAENSSWLAKGDWPLYMKHIREGIKRHSALFDQGIEQKLNLFGEYETHLGQPWTLRLLSDISNRRRILGIEPYGWLGHVGASGNIRRILSNGSTHEKQTLLSNINAILKLELPLQYSKLSEHLRALTKLKPTIKVWCRFLAITRPDLFCTIASLPVRQKLSGLLEKPQSHFETVEGYVELLKFIHHSPWFNSPKPKNKIELDIWKRRAAFLDVVLY